MRQAYDYWQDQPGSSCLYNNNADTHRGCHRGAGCVSLSERQAAAASAADRRRGGRVTETAGATGTRPTAVRYRCRLPPTGRRRHVRTEAAAGSTATQNSVGTGPRTRAAGADKPRRCAHDGRATHVRKTKRRRADVSASAAATTVEWKALRRERYTVLSSL